MKPKFNPFLLSASLAASIVVCFGQVAHADTFTWDANAGASGQTDGAGTWSNTTGTLWWDGVSANSIWSNTGPNDAVFGNFNGAAGTIAIGTAINVGNLTFNPAGSGNYTLSGAANTAANTLTLSGAAPTITTNQSATISALVSSSNGFVKEGLGSLTLNGSTATNTTNAIGGTITVNAGQLTVAGSPSFAGDGAFQSNLTLANFGRFTLSQDNRIGNASQITVGADAFARFNNSDSIGALAGSGRIWTTATLTLTSGTQNLTGVLSGTGGLNFSGSSVAQTLSGANLFTGTTTANSSGTTLALNNVNALQNSTLSKGSSAVTFIVAGTNTYNLGGLSGGSALNIGANTISVGGNNADTTFSSSIGFSTTSGGLIKVGTGKLTLSGTSIYTGATTISRGTLELTGAGGLATSGITFNGTSNFTYTGSAAGSSDSVGALTRSAGNGTITSTYGTSGNVALTFTSLAARTSGATANFVVSGGSNGTTNKIVLTGAAANAFIDQGTFFGGSNFAWYDTGGFVRALAYGSDTGAVTTAGGTTLAATAHQQTTAAVTAQNSATFTTLKIDGAHAFTLAGGQTLTVNGILKTGATATISGGSGIQAASGQDLVVRTDISTDALSINTPILANGTNAFVKTGAGDLTLGSLAVNTYTGGTFINQGKLIVNQDSNLGSTAAANNIQLNGGTLQPSATFSLNANHGIDVNAGGGTINGNAFQLTLGSANMLSGSGPLTISGSGSTNSVLNSGATQDYSGPMTISSGRIVLNAANITNPFGTGDITIGGASVYVNQSGSVWSNRFFISSAGAESRGAIRAQNGGTFNGDIILTNNATISSDGSGAVTSLNGNISGAFTLTLNGTGSATATSRVNLTGNNVHNATTVGLGITNIDHDVALGAYNGTVTINGNATLQAGAADIILNPDRTVAMSAASGAHNIDTQAFNMTIQGLITGASTEILNKQGAGKLTLSGTNTHTGVTGISAGILNVASLSDYGVASSIGARAAVSETATGDGIGIRIGTGTTGATLQYTGSTAQSTNRQIRISAASNTIDASGTGDGTLSFTHSGANTNLYDTVGDRTLILTGSNAGNNSFGISLADQDLGAGNLTTLTKSGTGKWVLTGVSSHTGGTNINGGILALSGSGTTGATTGAVALGGGQFDLGGLSRSVGAVSITAAYASGDTISNGTLTGTSYAASNSTGDAVVSAVLQGTGTLSKSGFGKLTLTNTANDFTGNVTLNTNSGTLRITSSGALGVGPKTVTNTSGSASVPVTGANLLELDSNGGADISLASNISYSLSGAAGVILNTAGNNTIAGNIGMTFGNGTVKILSNGGTLTLSGTVTANTNRDFELAGSSVGNIFSGILQNNGGNIASLVKSGSGTWTVSGGLNTFTGNTKVTEGTLKLTNNLAIQNSVFDTSGTGALDTEGVTTPTFGGLTAGSNLGLHSNVTSLTLNVAGTPTYSGNLSGGTAMQVTKTGTGTQTLSGNNGYTGLTTVSNGILNIQSPTALGTTAAGTVVNGTNTGTSTNARLELQGGITVTGEALTINGVGNFTGALNSKSGSNEWAGNVTIGSVGTRIGAQNGATLTVSGTIDSGAVSTGLVVRNEGTTATVILSGANTYLGDTALLFGKLQLDGGDNRLPVATKMILGNAANVTEFDLNGRNQEIAGLSLAGGVTATTVSVNNSSGTSSTLTINTAAASPSSYAGILKGNLGLTKEGADTLTLGGANTYDGVTTINEGTLALGAAGSIDNTSGVALGGGTFDVSAKSGGYTVNNLTGTGSVVGGLTVSTLLSIGNSPGEMTFGGDLTLGNATIVNFNYEFTGGDTAADLGIVSGDLTLDSAVFLNLFQLGSYTLGDTFTLFAYDKALTGTFFGLAEGDTTTDNLGGLWRINYAETSGGDNFTGSTAGLNFVNITAIPEPNVAALLGALGTLILLRRRRA